MSHMERSIKMELLWDKSKFDQEEVLHMSDEEVEYYHWLYFDDSVYDLM